LEHRKSFRDCTNAYLSDYSHISRFLIAFLLVGFGQPAWIVWLAPFSAIIGYALFWDSLRGVTSRPAQFGGALFWFTFVQLVQLSWMTSIEYQSIALLFVYLSLAIALGAQFAVMSLAVLKNRIWNFPKILAISGLWALIEWGRFHVLCGFSWNPAGIALTGFTLSLQLASIGGVLFLSFWVIMTNLLAFQSMVKKFSTRSFASWAIAAFLPYGLGAGILFHHDKEQKKYGVLRALLVQPGLLPSQKIPIEGRFEDFISPWNQWIKIFDHLKPYCSKDVDLIALPESTVPFRLDEAVYDYTVARDIIIDRFGSEAIKAFPALIKPYAKDGKVSNAFFSQFLANHLATNLIIGLDDQDQEAYYSSAIHFKPWKENMERYDKRILVPLAEYLPFAWCARLAKKYGIEAFYTPGKEAKLFSGSLPISVSICYEETFPDIVREGRLKGAHLFVNITNDNWYPDSKLARQHFDHGKLRAVENGVPLFRACNSGITSGIDAFGRVTAQLKEKQGVLLAEVPDYQINTIYTLIGDALIIGASLGFLSFYLLFRKMLSKGYMLVK
jgi:apolipoprotein N-acyltransferase